MCKYISMKDELDSLTVASKAKYGIESTMPIYNVLFIYTIFKMGHDL
ncbi:hypothetical protein [Lysinibacillus xylanilyticus]